MKRIIYLLVTLFIMSSTGFAQGILNSGTIDGMITWYVYDDGRLTLDGSGDISGYSSSSSVPWYEQRTMITSIELSGSIQSIGKYTFYACTNVTEINTSIPMPPSLAANTFNSSRLPSIALYVPTMYITDYQNAEYWGQMQISSSDGGTPTGNSNAYLSAIYVDGTMLDGFEPYTFAYQVELPEGTTTAPNVTYMLQDESCMSEVQQADSPNGYAKIIVTSSDGNMTNTYQITFSVQENTGGNPTGGDSGDGTIIDSGMLPGGTIWTLYSTGVMRFTGGGTMDSYNDPTEVPWYNNRLLVTELNFGADYFSLGSYLFYELDNLETINCYSSYMPTPLANTFNPNNLAKITANVRGTLLEQFQSDPYWSQMQLVVIPGTEPDNVVEGLIENDMFWSLNRNRGLLTISGTGRLPDWIQSMAPWSEYSSVVTYASIQEGITYCCNGAFASCENIKEIYFASTIDSIGEYILPSGSSQIQILVYSMTPPGITENTFAGIEGCVYVTCYESAYLAYMDHPIWGTKACMGYMDDPQTETDGTVTIALDENWHFIMLPQFGGINYEDIYTDQDVEWAIYDGAQRAGGQSGWKRVDFSATYYKAWAHIVRSLNGNATLSINLKGNNNNQYINIELLHHTASHPENANWNFIGNPYNAGYDINGLLAAGIESPITVWNGTGYSTYTPGIDEYKLQPFEPFFIQLPDEQNSGSIQLSPEYIDETMSLPVSGGSSSGDGGNTGDGGVADAYGALPGYFSIGEGIQVQFSRGNLQYNAVKGEWQFATNQDDYTGEDNANISDSYEGWIDMFGWGTCSNPTKVSEISADYPDFFDWGNNPISNGGGVEGIWRTLTSDEWLYLFESRTNAPNLYGIATVNGINGLVVLPDAWNDIPDISIFNPGVGNYSQNTYTYDEWSKMESAGAVFLPAAGGRDGMSTYNISYDGFYWASTSPNEDDAFNIHFDSESFYSQVGSRRYSGRSVRLVKSTDGGNGSDPTGGNEISQTYTFLTKAWDADEGSWMSGMDGYGFTNGRGVQCTTSTTGANAQCPITYSNISTVIVKYCTNSSTSGAGTIMIEIEGFNQSQEVTPSGGTELREMVFDFVDSMPSGAPSIMVNCSTNSIYIYSVTIITK